MKHLIWVIIPVLLIFGCTSEKENENHFRIDGTIANAEGMHIVLSQVGSRTVNPIDTAEIDKKGNFSFSTKVEAPDFYVLQLKNKPNAITLIGQANTKIEIKADATNFGEKYEVKGSKDSELIQQLNEKLGNTLDKIDELSMILQNNTDRDEEELLDSLNIVFETIASEHEEYLKTFIDNNSSSLASIIALSQSLSPRTTILNINTHKEYFEKVSESLHKAHPKAASVIALREYVEQASNPQVQDGLVAIGAVAPEIDLPNPDGDNISLSSTRGNYVLLDFWAAWCRPCREESPNLVANYEKYKEEGFDIYQVSLDRTREEWLNGIKADNLEQWHHVSDLQFWSSEAAQTYGIQAIPASFLLNPEGKIIAANLRGRQLGAKLQEIYGF